MMDPVLCKKHAHSHQKKVTSHYQKHTALRSDHHKEALVHVIDTEITAESLHAQVQRNPLSLLEKPEFERILRSEICKKISLLLFASLE